MERQQFLNFYEDEWADPQVISNYHKGNEDISVQDILKRAGTFKLSSKSFHLPTNERQIKASSFRTMQMSSCQNFERKTRYSEMYYPDMSECLDSTLEGSHMMQPFSHGWLLQNGSYELKRAILDKDERSHTPKSYLNTCDTAESKTATLENPKQKPVENSLDDYEKAIEKARQTAEKYSITEDSKTESSEEKSVTFLERLALKADDVPLQKSCESVFNTVLKAALIENRKPEPVDNSLDDYEKTIERARQIAEKYSVTEDLITETPMEKPLTFFEKLKSDDATLERSCEKTTDLTATNYLEKLKSKREETNLNRTAEVCVKSVLNKIRREIYVEAIRKNALNQINMLETFDLHQNGEQQNVALQTDICDAYNTTDLKKPRVSLLSSAHGFQWMEETKISKRKSWRNRIAGLFCLRRYEKI